MPFPCILKHYNRIPICRAYARRRERVQSVTIGNEHALATMALANASPNTLNLMRAQQVKEAQQAIVKTSGVRQH